MSGLGVHLEEHNWLSCRVSALFEVKAVARTGAKVDGSVRLDGWIRNPVSRPFCS